MPTITTLSDPRMQHSKFSSSGLDSVQITLSHSDSVKKVFRTDIMAKLLKIGCRLAFMLSTGLVGIDVFIDPVSADI